jgi:rubrerythrin
MNYLKLALTVSLALSSTGLFGARDLRSALDLAYKDEYAAYVRYQSVIQEFGEFRPFVNLVGAEERHMSLLAELYNSYGWSLPILPTPEFRIFSTFKNACDLSLDAERKNVQLYDELLSEVTDPEVASRFTYLRNASAEHHIPALTRCGGLW